MPSVPSVTLCFRPAAEAGIPDEAVTVSPECMERCSNGDKRRSGTPSPSYCAKKRLQLDGRHDVFRAANTHDLLELGNSRRFPSQDIIAKK